MKKMKISLGSIEDVKEFVALTNSYSFDSDLVSGRYAVDAKSIMGRPCKAAGVRCSR